MSTTDDSHADLAVGRFATCARDSRPLTGGTSTHDAPLPDEVVQALTAAGYLAALIPEEYGGAGLGIADAPAILEEVNRSGGNAGACHAQMYTMGTMLRHGTDAQKHEVAAADRGRRAAAAGLRRDRADERHRHDLASRPRAERATTVRDQRPEGLDLARRALGPDAAAGTDDAARAGRERRPKGSRSSGRPARGRRQGARRSARSAR